VPSGVFKLVHLAVADIVCRMFSFVDALVIVAFTSLHICHISSFVSVRK